MKLAQPGDPLVDGVRDVVPAERVSKATASVIPRASSIIPKVRRAISEFPAAPNMQTVTNTVLVYALLGMSDNEIAHVLNTTIEDIEHLRMTEVYQETYEMLHREMISVNSSSLQARIASYAADAVTNIVDLANDKPQKGENGDMAYLVPPIVILKANQDILDRSGMSADVLFGNDNDGDNTLNIVVHNDGDEKTNINVNVNIPKGR